MSRKQHAFNVHVARKVQERRRVMGLSQRQLADAIGVTFQQVQKYENGSNRMDAARLVMVAAALAVPPQWFFEGYDADGTAAAVLQQFDEDNLFEHREALTLVRAFRRVGSQDLRDRIVHLAAAVADSESGHDHFQIIRAAESSSMSLPAEAAE